MHTLVLCKLAHLQLQNIRAFKSTAQIELSSQIYRNIPQLLCNLKLSIPGFVCGIFPVSSNYVKYELILFLLPLFFYAIKWFYLCLHKVMIMIIVCAYRCSFFFYLSTMGEGYLNGNLELVEWFFCAAAASCYRQRHFWRLFVWLLGLMCHSAFYCYEADLLFSKEESDFKLVIALINQMNKFFSFSLN